jgi:predicted transposase YbfD/YdcC
MKKEFEKWLLGVEDPRSDRNQKHPFMTLIGTSFLAAISGFDKFTEIQYFVEAHIEDLSNYFEFPNGVPSHDTYRRIWDIISPTQFISAFHDFVDSLSKFKEGIISIDGKTIRNSGRENPLHIVSAWSVANKLVLAQQKVDSKSNEITAIPLLLEIMDIDNCTITIDAMGAQREICEKIVKKNGEYVISLKGNQGTLHEDVSLYMQDGESYSSINENNDKGHGRIEQRIAYVSQSIDWLQEHHKWPGLKSIGKIESHVWRKDKETTETRYYISSKSLTASELNEIARAHWGIENELHWRLDVVFNEDKACIRNDNASENMDILRKWALNILHKAKRKPDQPIKAVMKLSSMSFKYLLETVKRIFHA